MIPRIYVEGLSNIFDTKEDGLTYDYSKLKDGVKYTDKSVYYIVAGLLDNDRTIKNRTITKGDTFIWTRGKLFSITNEYDLAAVEAQISKLQARTAKNEEDIADIKTDIQNIWNAINNLEPGKSIIWESL